MRQIAVFKIPQRLDNSRCAKREIIHRPCCSACRVGSGPTLGFEGCSSSSPPRQTSLTRTMQRNTSTSTPHIRPEQSTNRSRYTCSSSDYSSEAYWGQFFVRNSGCMLRTGVYLRTAGTTPAIYALETLRFLEAFDKR